MTTEWRFRDRLPEGEPLRVVFASDKHFVAGAEAASRVIEARPELAGACELIPAATLSEAVLSRAHVVIPLMERIDAAVLSRAPQVRLVMQFGVGLEGVEVEACTRRGVCVSNVPAAESGNATSTAEHALFLSLALFRLGAEKTFAAKVLGGARNVTQLSGKPVLVVGHGSVGRRLVAVFDALGATALAAHAHRSWRDDETSLATKVDLVDGLARARLVVLCCPLTPATRHLVDAAFLDRLQPGTFLVNVGRGPLAQRDVVLDALRDGRLAGFASDVGADADARPAEPFDPDDDLATHPRAIFSPHLGGYSDNSYASMAHSLADALAAVRLGAPPPVWINDPGDAS